MAIDERILTQIADLIVSGGALAGRADQGVAINESHHAQCLGWIGAADHMIEIVCLAPTHAIRRASERIIAGSRGYTSPQAVGGLRELLSQLEKLIQNGLIQSVEDEVSAETFDDLVDHAEAYLADNRKDPAGAIVGVVFEDTLHRLCRKYRIDDSDKSCEPLIHALSAAGVFTRLELKEAIAAAGLRTSAAHARWDEFKGDQVEAVIKFTRRLIREKLSG